MTMLLIWRLVGSSWGALTLSGIWNLSSWITFCVKVFFHTKVVQQFYKSFSLCAHFLDSQDNSFTKVMQKFCMIYTKEKIPVVKFCRSFAKVMQIVCKSFAKVSVNTQIFLCKSDTQVSHIFCKTFLLF